MARTPTKVKSTDKEKLLRENQRLAEENAKLVKQLTVDTSTKQKKRIHFWRNFAMYICIILAGVTLVAGNFLFWIGRTVLNNNQYNATMTAIIQEPSVQQAIALYTTNQIFQNIDTQSYIEQVLPPKADFLAPTLNSQLKSATQSTINKLLASNKFQQLWISTNAKAHAQILNYIEHYQGDGEISLNDLYQGLSANLKNTPLAFLANKTLPTKVGTITVLHANWLPTAHRVVAIAPYMKWILSALFLGFSGIAIWLSQRRRRMVLTLAILFGVLMLITSIAARVTPNLIAQSVNADYQTAVKDVVSAIVEPLLTQTRTLLSLSVLTIVIAWISGSYPAAVATRRRISYLTEGKIHTAIFGQHENGLTRWVGAHRRLLQWTSVTIVAFIMLLVTLSPLRILLYGLLMVILVLLIEVLSASTTSKDTRVATNVKG